VASWPIGRRTSRRRWNLRSAAVSLTSACRPQGALFIDWVAFSQLAPSAPSARKAESTKIKTYKHCDGEVLPCAVSVRGGLSATTLRVLRGLEQYVHAERDSLVIPFVVAVVAASASIVACARLRSGSRAARDPAYTPPPAAHIPLSALPPLDDEDAAQTFENGKLNSKALSSPFRVAPQTSPLATKKKETKSKKRIATKKQTTTSTLQSKKKNVRSRLDSLFPKTSSPHKLVFKRRKMVQRRFNFPTPANASPVPVSLPLFGGG
jgi:hypothetical protein